MPLPGHYVGNTETMTLAEELVMMVEGEEESEGTGQGRGKGGYIDAQRLGKVTVRVRSQSAYIHLLLLHYRDSLLGQSFPLLFFFLSLKFFALPDSLGPFHLFLI
jgi:hypothetical protein